MAYTKYWCTALWLTLFVMKRDNRRAKNGLWFCYVSVCRQVRLQAMGSHTGRHGIRYDKTVIYTIGPLVMSFIRAIGIQNGALTTRCMSQTCCVFRALIRSKKYLQNQQNALSYTLMYFIHNILCNMFRPVFLPVPTSTPHRWHTSPTLCIRTRHTATSVIIPQTINNFNYCPFLAYMFIVLK